LLRAALKPKESTAIGNELDQTFQDFNGVVFRTAYRITGNAADAEDVLQTVFLRLLRRDAACGEITQTESYLRRAAIHCSLDLIRQRQREALKAAGAAPDPASTVDPELRESLKQALAELDPRPAEMFVLRYFEGYSNEEIAAQMGVSRLVVAVTLHRARRRLQKAIQ
jgi:RNA polymerase sigma-70 factor (ECF subfamily)